MEDGIRVVSEAESDALRAIYAPYVSETCISLEMNVPSAGDYRVRVTHISAVYPYLAWVRSGRIVGFAYASSFNDRAGYAYGASTSVYLDPEAYGGGVGRRLYGCLLELMRLQNLRVAYAITTLPNDRSLALQAAFGFVRVGVCSRAGRKLGRWLDVLWQEKHLGDFPDQPPPVTPFPALDKTVSTEVMARWTATAAR